MKLEHYTNLLTILEREVKPHDSQTAYNLARELSILYVKLHYDEGTAQNRVPIVNRLTSMISYIHKTIPDHTESLGDIILDAIDAIKNPA